MAKMTKNYANKWTDILQLSLEKHLKIGPAISSKNNLEQFQEGKILFFLSSLK